ncbi:MULTISPECIES: BatD family protein [Cellulophaga]|uniref:BatD family protein n=1 Tax=Cellulophaga TaxID=104264 RepID=UPI00209171E4|nr:MULTISPECIES: BatD family protein [Cellulophaga]MDO6767131.1 BatD family protein [Cellulophaga sp. 1_MG-2023]
MNSNYEKLKLRNIKSLFKRLTFLCLIFTTTFGFSQTVKSEVDVSSIKIGEQINFIVNVEASETDNVIFPEGQTFAPLEMVESFATDTIKEDAKFTLIKKYALTQFDSGSYTLPRQQITINEKPFFTDSLRIDVNTLVVDTLAQKMYDIKDITNVEKTSTFPWAWVLGVIIALAIIGGLLYWFVWRKKTLTEEEKVALLPPYDRAMLELKKLENSKYLIQDEYKQYYSELTDIVRSYLEEDVHISALESTTDQLIEKLEMLKDAGNLKIDDDTLNQFKRILQTSDLVKFAKSKPDTSIAEQDRKSIENIVTKTKDAIPPPTEEELLQREEYLEELERKKQRRKVNITIITIASIVVIALGVCIKYFGFNYIKDTVFGHPTKELLESDWVASSYGYPPISIETPKVLLRQKIELPAEAKASIKEYQMFFYNSALDLFSIGVTSTTLKQEIEPNIEQSVDLFLKDLESKGAKNITTKSEEFITKSGVKGLKSYGSGMFKVPGSDELVNGKYTILTFAGKGFQQQVLLTWLDGDTYAEEIVNRIITSVEVKTE